MYFLTDLDLPEISHRSLGEARSPAITQVPLGGQVLNMHCSGISYKAISKSRMANLEGAG